MLEVVSNEAASGAKIIIIGVGGGGNNTVDRMIKENVGGVEFFCINTDKQQLKKCLTPNIVQIGENITRGLGAGADPSVGAAAANENLDDIIEIVRDADMVFVTCGMGGGTGTGAAPIVAKAAKEAGALTVGVVTKPFKFEGKTRMNNALLGIEELKKNVDTLIVVPNDKLLEIADRKTSLPDALQKADEVLQQGIQGITDLIYKPGLINLDFADVKTVMENKGLAHFGIGTGEGTEKCMDAVKIAVNSPLLETSIEHASHAIINVSGDITLIEVNEAMELVQEIIGEDSTVIFGAIYDEEMKESCTVTIIATGLSGYDDRSRLGTRGNRFSRPNSGGFGQPSSGFSRPGISSRVPVTPSPGRPGVSMNERASAPVNEMPNTESLAQAAKNGFSGTSSQQAAVGAEGMMGFSNPGMNASAGSSPNNMADSNAGGMASGMDTAAKDNTAKPEKTKKFPGSIQIPEFLRK